MVSMAIRPALFASKELVMILMIAVPLHGWVLYKKAERQIRAWAS